jgi:hypothetical protein
VDEDLLPLRCHQQPVDARQRSDRAPAGRLTWRDDYEGQCQHLITSIKGAS